MVTIIASYCTELHHSLKVRRPRQETGNRRWNWTAGSCQLTEGEKRRSVLGWREECNGDCHSQHVGEVAWPLTGPQISPGLTGPRAWCAYINALSHRKHYLQDGYKNITCCCRARYSRLLKWTRDMFWNIQFKVMETTEHISKREF